MATTTTIMADLKKRRSEKFRSTLARHGMPADRILGVSVADLKLIAKTIKGQQPLAYELYDTGILEPMYLAGLIADGSQMTKAQVNSWAASAESLPMIFEYVVPWVATENPHARALALQWIDFKKKEHIASAGWCTYAGLLATKADEELGLAEIEQLLTRIVKEIGAAQNRVRYNMNGFVIAAGTYVQPLLNQAQAAALKIGSVSVDMGQTACRIPLASAYIEKVVASGRQGRKRKTIRC